MKKLIVVTGTARGIGKAISENLQRNGFSVLGIDKDVCDLSDAKAIHELAADLKQKGTKISGLVNNAALNFEKECWNTSATDLDLIFKTNVFSIFHLVREFINLFETPASIVNISSVHSFATSSKLSAYAATKGAVSALTRSFAIELGPNNIRVNAVAPGAVDTEMLKLGISRSTDPASMLEKIKQTSPLNKIGTSEEVAELVHFLINPKLSSNITGQEFIIDSGVLARLASE